MPIGLNCRGTLARSMIEIDETAGGHSEVRTVVILTVYLVS